MSRTTPATLALDRAGVAYERATYDYDPDAQRIGLQAAEALGVPPSEVWKTLMAQVDGAPVCVVLPCQREVSMKKLAAAAGGKSAQMMKPADAERITGYKVGGVSPFGQKRRVPIFIDPEQPRVRLYVNGGRRGLQLRLTFADLVAATDAVVTALT